jgi:AhpD family alkylhydroperoxidase
MNTSKRRSAAVQARPNRLMLAGALAACLLMANAARAMAADDFSAAYQDITETFGSFPGFFWLFPRDQLAETWDAFTALQMNPDIVVDARTRELIGVAVASQGGSCRSCVYFHAAAALANGASREEIREAVSIGVATQRLDAAISEAGSDLAAFKRETDLVLWGDARTIELRGPSPDLCSFISAGAAGGTVGCE